MAVLPIAKLGNPILRKIAEPVSIEELLSEGFQLFIDDMIETMRAKDGVGLAAPQVFQSKQLVVIESHLNPRYTEAPEISLLVLVNPLFTFLSPEKVEGWEGCLSVDNLRGKVKRSKKTALKALDRKGEKIEIETDTFLAVILQHEIDHLHGRLFVDQISDVTSLSQLEEFNRYALGNKEQIPVA
ncbi:MAG: peptide deformylase [Nitrospirae bacterium]|nr:peptide deformylase [Nitrospirota bacterium]MBI3352231.1 peptide deformylase [Nitrospirota bacterium]